MNSVSLAVSLLIFVLIFRSVIQGSKKPLHESGRKLLLPILYISTSLFQLFDPTLHLMTGEVISFLAGGAVLSIPLILLTRFQRQADGKMYYQRNVALYVVLVVIFVLRFLDFTFIRGVDAQTLGFLNSLMAFSYISIWRLGSYIKFRSARTSSVLRSV